MKIKYNNYVNLSNFSLAQIYSLLDMINYPNSNTSCTNQSNLFLEFLRKKSLNVKVLRGNTVFVTAVLGDLFFCSSARRVRNRSVCIADNLRSHVESKLTFTAPQLLACIFAFTCRLYANFA